MKILVIEPKPFLQKSIGAKLEKLGHAVLTLNETEGAISFLNRFWPDAIIMNIEPNGPTALQFCSEVLELFGELPPIVIHYQGDLHRHLAAQPIHSHFPDIRWIPTLCSEQQLSEILNQAVWALTDPNRKIASGYN